MSTVLERPPVRAAPDRARPDAPDPDRWAARGLRFAAFVALVLYGTQHWARQVAPTPNAAPLQITAVATLAAVAFTLAGHLRPGHTRRLVLGLLLLLGSLAALTAAGIPLRFAGWRNWALLGDGVSGGLAALPDLSVPYRGLDEWVRWVVLAGAGLLAVLAALLAFGPGPGRSGQRPAAAGLALGVLYGLPVVERNPASPFLSGAVFAILLALFLGADRLTATRGVRPRALACGGALLALGLAALLAPRLDGARPWVDYRGIVGDIAQRNQAVFNWNHTYMPLTWPRDGRELLRVRAKEPAYWKATTLRRFDGKRWIEAPIQDPSVIDTPMAAAHPEWREELEVSVRGLRSEEYLTAGYATAVDGLSTPPVPVGSGTYRTGGRPLRPGDTYRAKVYTPRPTPAELRDAGTDYPDYARGDELSIELPESVGGPRAGEPFPNGVRETTIFFPPFGSDSRPSTVIPGVRNFVGGEALLATSGYGRMWALAQQLRREATSPFDLVRMVRARVQQGTRYTERPPQSALPLESFLFDSRAGYCQQFSGAMALLLRMAGVPARVASGFTSGSFDSQRGQYIVRDLDAHSWVEAFFPGIGWVTFDPTPSVAPPAAQKPGDGGVGPKDSGGADDPTARADVAEPVAPAAPAAKAGSSGTGGGGPPTVPLLLAGLLVLAVGAGGWAWRRTYVPPTALDELRRALARTGRPVAPGLTLQALERSLETTPEAASYVRSLRQGRYAGDPVPPPAGARSALRRELAAGGGLRRRLQAWWALPPRRAAGPAQTRRP